MLPIDLWRRRRRRSGERCDGAAVLLAETVAQRQIVVHACRRAREMGVRPGMALSAARAALGPSGLVVEAHDAMRTGRALRALGLWCHRFSPVVAVEDAEGVCLDLTGCAHLFGGERSMLERVQSGASRLGFEICAAIAPTFSAARGLARWGGHGVIVDAHGLMDSVRDLPVESLGLDADSIAGLGEVNIRAIGQLLALPRASIAARFGAEILAGLDRMLGRAPERIDPLRPAEVLRVNRVFEGPCACVETIGLACAELIEGLCRLLAARESGASEWSVTLGRSDMEPLTITLRHCVPSRELRHLRRMLTPRLERAHLGYGVEWVTMTALRTERLAHHQAGWWDGADDEAGERTAGGALIDTLIGRLGEGAVLRAEALASRVPERAFVLRSALVGSECTGEEVVEGDRPTRLLDPPRPARVIALSPDGPLSRLEWARGAHHIAASIGPERIKGEWWLGDRFVRDYFRVQDERGVWLWVFRDHASARWFVHGVWE